jgi:SAM-dependent methyltransferase
MCNAACIEFGSAHLPASEVRNRRVMEVGSLNVNGSLRRYVESLGPFSYTGVDVVSGPGVDELCDVSDLVARYGPDQFDVVISTEMLEHVRNWRVAVSNLKSILKPGGALLLTTRSKGFEYHGYPRDYWRYEIGDMDIIFSDLSVEVLEQDPLAPGVFVKARKLVPFVEKNLEAHALYSIVTGRRCKDVANWETLIFGSMRAGCLLVARFVLAIVKAGVKRLRRQRETLR